MQPFRTLPLSFRVSTGVLILRLVAGLAFMFHGYEKIQHPFDWMGPDAGVPGIFQGLAAVSEFCGGLAWILGLLTPLASLGIACTMAFALRLHILVLHDPFVGTKDHFSSFEPAAGYLCLALFFVLAGPGRFSLDRAFFGERV